MVGLTRADERAVRSVLGRDHPLARAVANQHTLAVHSVVAACAVAGATFGELVHVRHATLLLVVALGTSASFVACWVVTRQAVSDRARDVIARGGGNLVLPVVARERRRLASRTERERLARALEEVHRDVLRSSSLLPQFRPLPGVAQLRYVTREVEALAVALRHDEVRVQGVALVVRLLSDGHESPLYAGKRDPLRQELNRIRYLLESTDERASDTPAERKAA